MDPDVEASHTSSLNEDVDMISVPEVANSIMLNTPPPSEVMVPAMSPARAASVELHDAPTSVAVPPIEEQVKTIKTLIDAADATALQDGQKMYLISTNWLSQAMAMAEGKPVPKESTHPESLGPVDNSDIIEESLVDANGQEFSILKPGLTQIQFKYIPEDAWNLIVEWHQLAPNQFPILRIAHNTADDGENIQIENYPPILKLHRIWSANTPIPIDQKLKRDNPPAPRLVNPSACMFNTFLKEAKSLLGIELSRKVRVWRMPPKLPAGNTTPVPGPQASWRFLVDVSEFTQLEDGDQRDKVDCKDQTANPNYNGKSMSLSLAGLGTSMSIALDEEVDSGMFVTTFTTQALSSKTRGPKTTLSLQARSSGSGRISPAPSGPVTRGRSTNSRPGHMLGTAGLQNLGNTCYMNSALQCLRSVEELTKYFLTHEAEKEINTTNPLGHNGDIARAYGRLLEQFYSDSSSGYVTPRLFKTAVGRYAPMFSGYGQQDSQEFLGFLLDGLQEDLSRVKKKPYIEKPDSTDEMINNPKLIAEMAEKVWDITRKRDDSVIADLFVGMYKSTLVCPICSKVSITFDPFNNLTLQLPVKSSFRRDVRFFPLNDRPVILPIDLDRNSNIRGLKEFVAPRVGTTTEKLIVAENFGHKFYAIYKDTDGPVHDKLQPHDFIDIFELEHKPSNWPDPRPVKKKTKVSSWGYSNEDTENTAPRWDDPLADHMVVPVLYRKASKSSGWTNYKRVTFDPPHFIMLTPEEARSEDIIRRKVLQKLATFSTWDGFKCEPDESTSEESTDPEMIPSGGGSDGESSSEGKVQAKSIDSEDDMIDVTMDKNLNGKVPSHYPLKHFNKIAPYWANPQEFLPPQLQNLFQLRHFTENNMLPKGSHTDQDFAPLSNRMPAASSPPSAANCTESDLEDEDGENSHQTRMASESEEYGPTGGPIPKNNHKHVRNQRNNRRKGKNNKTYGKKHQQRQNGDRLPRTAFQRQQQLDAEHDDDRNGPLVRLGEGIMVEFSEDAYGLVFYNGLDLTPTKLNATSSSLLTLIDPEIIARDKELERRRRDGMTLDTCLEEFEKEEILAEEDQWYCPRCKDHVRASKKFELWKTPDILVIHLKRFSNSGYRRDKIDLTVEFEIEGLDLTDRVIDKTDDKPEIYDLIAVDNHWGGLGGGHYTAITRNFSDGQWYDYNDSSVSKNPSRAKIVSNSAYLLFYRRRSNQALGGTRLQEICERFDNPRPDENTQMDSGEGQRLGGGSSLYGSPDALPGVGVTLHRGSLGLDSDGILEPDTTNGEVYSTFPSIANSGEATVNSVEHDEGLGDMASAEHNAAHYTQNWTFKNITGDDRAQVSEGDANSIQAMPSGRNSVFDSDENAQFSTEDIFPPPWDMDVNTTTIGNSPSAVFIQESDPEDYPAAEIHLSDNEDDGAAPAPVVPRGRTSGSN